MTRQFFFSKILELYGSKIYGDGLGVLKILEYLRGKTLKGVIDGLIVLIFKIDKPE